MEYGINSGNERIGTACVTQEGLFYRIHCRCRITEKAHYKILLQGETEIDLGICVPIDDGFGIDTLVPVKKAGRGVLRFQIITRETEKTAVLVGLSSDKPFHDIQKLGNAYLEYQNGQPALAFIDQSLTQRDNDQSP